MEPFSALPGRRFLERIKPSFERVLLALTLSALAVGGIATLVGGRAAAEACWAVGTLAAILPAVWWVLSALRQGRLGVDLIAVFALLGTLVIHQYLAGAVIAVMLTGGRALEAAATQRASRDLKALLERAPRFARRRVGSQITVVPLADIGVGDVVVVAGGDVVPVDGRLVAGVADLDESALTGESAPVERRQGQPVRSGVVNAGDAFELNVTASAADSTYAGIVDLAQQAAAESAPVVRLADRYAAWFLLAALLTSTGAWLVSKSIVRAVAVLVVATPCPLLLAAPVAIVAGLSRASRAGVVIRGGGALENLGHATTLVLDKTGTLTMGCPVVVDIAAAPGISANEILRLAASVDQISPHVLAQSIVTEALARGMSLQLPTDVKERAGRGVSGMLDGWEINVGKLDDSGAVDGWARAAVNRARLDNAALAWVCIDGVPKGAVLLRDPIRRQAPRTMRRLRAAGFDRLVMLTGDRMEPAREVGTVLGLDEVYAQQTPTDKVAAVRTETERAITVMVGDGINDAPALAAASVGVAMGARGATASSEAADIVLTTDRLDRLADAMDIARWSRRIAVQSAAIGIGLSVFAMVLAAAGLLPPVAGALVQEAIDVGVILNALRALGGNPTATLRIPVETQALLQRFSTEHDELRDAVGMIRDCADQLVDDGREGALQSVAAAYTLLTDRIMPHEWAEERQLYPALAKPLHSGEATVTMSRTHAEIQRLTDRIGAHVRLAEEEGQIRADQVNDLLASLYGLYALLRLHFLQEEEGFFALAPEAADGLSIRNAV